MTQGGRKDLETWGKATQAPKADLVVGMINQKALVYPITSRCRFKNTCAKFKSSQMKFCPSKEKEITKENQLPQNINTNT